MFLNLFSSLLTILNFWQCEDLRNVFIWNWSIWAKNISSITLLCMLRLLLLLISSASTFWFGLFGCVLNIEQVLSIECGHIVDLIENGHDIITNFRQSLLVKNNNNDNPYGKQISILFYLAVSKPSPPPPPPTSTNIIRYMPVAQITLLPNTLTTWTSSSWQT